MAYKITFEQFDEMQLSINNLLNIYIAMPIELEELSDLLGIEMRRLNELQKVILENVTKELSNE